ncbi:histidine phosphatase family protein [Roseovarius sp. 2305UL8-3]|uniref:histidine phosphatase family protein n=1 Tax=Roseovarius conchicola TaxID=3121636 RepID=UPI003528CEB0
MTRIALLRHGHTPWNRAGRIQGQSDIALDEDARTDLAAFALPAPWDKAQVISSPLCRATETAELVSGHPPEIVPALREMHWGDWEGQKGLDLKADPASGFRDIEHWGWDYQPPGGESPKQVWARVSDWLTTVTTDTVVVSHMGIMRVLLARATGWDFDGPAPFWIKRNRLYILQITPRLRLAQDEPVRLIPRDTQ